MGSKTICYVDTETTGLGDEHELWELAIVKYEGEEKVGEFLMQFHVDLAVADPYALRVGGFWERRVSDLWLGDECAAQDAYRLLDGAVLAGINPAFDERMLVKFFRSHRLPVRSHYYTPFDVRTYAVGVGHATGLIELDEEPKTDEVFKLFKVNIPEEHRHTALGDAVATRDLHVAARSRAGYMRGD